jgi:ferredoxin--NADP+ reductase
MVVENKGTLTYIRVLKDDLEILRIKPQDGPVPDFKAGQFVTLAVNNPADGKVVRRAYSIASPPEQKKNTLNY